MHHHHPLKAADQHSWSVPKRKASALTGHFGERADSAQMAVRLIALSRVLLTKDAAVLSTVAVSVHGADLLNQLLAATLRLAIGQRAVRPLPP